MPTNFPNSDDVFSVPSTPVSVPLGQAGDSTRKHSQSHGDIGDAIEAMQAEATLLVHSHDGVTFRHGSKLSQANTHQSVDTDSGTGSLHHTIGSGANQYAAGDHTHAAVVTYPVGAFFFAVVPRTRPRSVLSALGQQWARGSCVPPVVVWDSLLVLLAARTRIRTRLTPLQIQSPVISMT